MADYEYRTAIRGPLLITVSATGSTILETGTRSGIPETSDMDANPYTTSGQTRHAIMTRTATGIDMTTLMGGQKMFLGPWLETNAATSIAAVAQTLGEVAGMTQLGMCYAGSIIGVAARANANITAGTLRAAVTVNGATRFSAVNSATGVAYVGATQAKDTDTFVVGDGIGLKLTTSADYAPTTLEWTFNVIVEI